MKKFPQRAAIAFLLLLVASRLNGQENSLAVSVRGSLTTGSQLFTNPNSPDPFERIEFVPIEDLLGGGVEVRYVFPETHFGLSLSAEYIRATNNGITSQGAPIEDGYRVVPIELTAYFIIPVSGPTVDIYMGGGTGAYLGERIYRLAGVEANVVDRGTGFGIHVLAGTSFNLTDVIAVTGEMKFRDLQFKTSNAFSVERIVYNGGVITVGTEPFSSRVNTNGIVFQLGLMLNIL